MVRMHYFLRTGTWRRKSVMLVWNGFLQMPCPMRPEQYLVMRKSAAPQDCWDSAIRLRFGRDCDHSSARGKSRSRENTELRTNVIKVFPSCCFSVPAEQRAIGFPFSEIQNATFFIVIHDRNTQHRELLLWSAISGAMG